MEKDTGPLCKIKILDLTRYVPGAFATQIFGDLGAEVIKFEEVLQGDMSRLDLPMINGESYYFHAVNRNKKSLALNLKTKAGKEIFYKLAAGADVIIENFRPGVTKRLGINYEEVKKINPGIVYCSLSGFGQENPKSTQATHDINFLAASGFLDLCLSSGMGLPPIFFADMAGSMFAASSIAMALLIRQSTGEGQYVDVSLFDAFLSWHTLLFSRSYVLGREFSSKELQYTGAALCYNVYKTKDDAYMAVGMIEPKFWEEFCDSMGLGELRAKQFTLRQDEPEAYAKIEQVFAGKTQQEWIEWLDGRDLCINPVVSLGTAMKENSAENNGIIGMINIPKIGPMLQTGFPVKFSGISTSLMSASPPPALGQHTTDLLQQIGFSRDEIKEFNSAGIIKFPESES